MVWKSVFIRLLVTFPLVFIISCETFAPGPPAEKPSLRLARDYTGALDDDMGAAFFNDALAASVAYFSRLDPATKIRFGDRDARVAELIASLKRLGQIFAQEPDPAKREKTIRDEFDIYQGTGTSGDGNVLVTGYYQPILQGGLHRNARYRWPLYRKPDDLVSADLGRFSSDLKGRSVRGRVENGKLIPYYNRHEIDGNGALSGKGLEIVWVDNPVDVFFLHVQGSGIVRLEDGSRFFVNYAEANGHGYKSIGKLLIDEGAIPKDDVSMQSIRRWLADHPAELARVLDSNPSYVFFRRMDDGPFGSTGARLIAGRSAAFDPAQFPRGAVGHIVTTQPVVKNGAMTGTRKISRFIFNHDQGGAIKGAGRMDMFLGAGREAEETAGYMKQSGELVFVILKKGRGE